jgi:hypothetical protein
VRRRPPENIDARENLASVPPLSLPFACVRRRFALSCVALRVCCPGIFSTLNRPGPVPRPGRREKAWIQPTQGLTEHVFFSRLGFFPLEGEPRGSGPEPGEEQAKRTGPNG